MGQFGNQPDFATSATQVASLPATPTEPSAIYIGELTDSAVAASIVVNLGNDSTNVTFKSITTGFLPVIVTKIVSATNINANSIIFIR
jgi:hypothetical protein